MTDKKDNEKKGGGHELPLHPEKSLDDWKDMLPTEAAKLVAKNLGLKQVGDAASEPKREI